MNPDWLWLTARAPLHMLPLTENIMLPLTENIMLPLTENLPVHQSPTPCYVLLYSLIKPTTSIDVLVGWEECYGHVLVVGLVAGLVRWPLTPASLQIIVAVCSQVFRCCLGLPGLPWSSRPPLPGSARSFVVL